MKNQLWLGTEASLTDLAASEKWASENAISLMDRRKAFVEDIGGEPRKGEMLLEVTENGVGIIKVHGSLTNGHKWWHQYAVGSVTSYEAIIDALAIAVEDDSIESIVLDLSTGGGAAMGVDNAADAIYRANRRKPVRAHTATAAFSAGYWLAAAAREIVTTRMAEVGSIGTLMVHQSMAKMAEKMGVEITVFRAGKYKAMGLPVEELSDDAKEYIQADIEKANSFFLEHVSLRRNLTLSSKGVWAEGKTFFAEDAQAVGLVDRILSLEELVSASGAASTTHRSRPMFISDENRARIAAGANPEDVLTEAELEQYRAEIESAAATSEEPAEGEEAETQAEAPTAGEEASEEPSVGFGEGITAEAYREALRDNGKLEAKLESAEARAEAAEQKLETMQAQMSSVAEIGKQAVKNLQVALGKSQEIPSTPEGIVSAYNDLQTEMSARFKTGRQSQETVEGQDSSANMPLAFRHTQARARTQNQ